MTHTLNLGTIYGTPVFTLKSRDPAVKAVYGANFSGADSTWRFPAFYPVHDIVIKDLCKTIPNITISPEVKNYVQKVNTPPELPADYKFITQPYQHQRDGLMHAYRYMRAGLFFAPGLGKCKITVDLQRLVKDPMLIICPLVMLSTWADEFEKHGNIKDVTIIDGDKEEKLARIAQAQVTTPTATIVTYKVATLYYEELIKIKYSAIILDESHYLQSPFSSRSKVATLLARRARRRVILSGTPSLGSPFDLYGQLRFLGTYFCPEHWWEFRKMFGVFPDHQADEKVPKMLLGYKNIDLMNERVNLICQRKTKEDCLDLPAQTIIDIRFPLYPEAKKIYNTLIEDRCLGAGDSVREDLVNGELTIDKGPELKPYVIADETISVLSKLDQIASNFYYLATKNPGICNGCEHVRFCSQAEIAPFTKRCQVVLKEPPRVLKEINNNARLERCMGLLESILKDEENKVIIWCRYIHELDTLQKAFTAQKIQFVRVQGGMARADLDTAVKTFNKDAKCRVYLGQVATGIGITLNAANYTIYYNLPWSLEQYLQSMDRNYRIGQDKKVTVYRLLGRYTLDESKATALDQKVDFAQLITAKAVCATCPDYYKRCRKHNIKLYDDECKFDRTMYRNTASIRLIP